MKPPEISTCRSSNSTLAVSHSKAKLALASKLTFQKCELGFKSVKPVMASKKSTRLLIRNNEGHAWTMEVGVGIFGKCRTATSNA